MNSFEPDLEPDIDITPNIDPDITPYIDPDVDPSIRRTPKHNTDFDPDDLDFFICDIPPVEVQNE